MTAKFMGIPHDLPPAFEPGANVSRGASFAVDSASILGTARDSVTFLNYLCIFIMQRTKEVIIFSKKKQRK